MPCDPFDSDADFSNSDDCLCFRWITSDSIFSPFRNPMAEADFPACTLDGTFSDYFTVGCKTDKGLTVLLIERGEGLETRPIKV